MLTSRSSFQQKTICILDYVESLISFEMSVSVVAIFWAKVLRHLVVEDACFRMRITLAFVLIRSLACTKCVPGRLRSGSGVALN